MDGIENKYHYWIWSSMGLVHFGVCEVNCWVRVFKSAFFRDSYKYTRYDVNPVFWWIPNSYTDLNPQKLYFDLRETSKDLEHKSSSFTRSEFLKLKTVFFKIRRGQRKRHYIISNCVLFLSYGISLTVNLDAIAQFSCVTHWSRMTHIYVIEPGRQCFKWWLVRRESATWPKAELLSVGPWGT